MVILGIETSCDETSLALIETKEVGEISVLAHTTLSQADKHAVYGGVFPSLAKREHQKNLIPLLKTLLAEASVLDTKIKVTKKHTNILKYVGVCLEREPELAKQFMEFIPTIEKPPIDLIAVTAGPGLEPALWVGINFAKALAALWNIPLVPIDHMEGHVLVSLLKRNEDYRAQRVTQNVEKNPLSSNATCYKLHAVHFPAIALLISGGHTELVLIKKPGRYEIIGETKDDAVGEAFDKVARILGLPYPGGPEISALAEQARRFRPDLPTYQLKNLQTNIKLPRPMINSGDFNFSFSGLKTAVLYTVKKIPRLTDQVKAELAREFEDAVTEVLLSKTLRAIQQYHAPTLILGGGVVANRHIREAFEKIKADKTVSSLLVPAPELATDNALMIALAATFVRNRREPTERIDTITACGDMRLTD